MGESFLGFPNRFKIVNNLLEKTYNPNHTLSSYMGYVLYKKFDDYLTKSGGTIDGSLTTSHVFPYTASVFDIGTPVYKYRNVYANTFYGNVDGNAETSSKLQNKVKISITGAVTGTCTFDGSEDVSVDTSVSHNHNKEYLSLSGGTLKGNLILHNSSILGTNNKYLLTLTQDNILQINYGTYMDRKGNTTIYSNGDLDVRTHSSGLTITSSLFEKTVNVGTSQESVFIQNTSSNTYLHLTDDGKIVFGDNEVYHHGNFKPENVLYTEYKDHMDDVEQIIKALAIILDKLEVAVGNKDNLDYPDQEITDVLKHYKDSAMDILGHDTRQKGD